MKDTWNFLPPKRHEVKIFSTTSGHAVSFKKKKKCQKALALLQKLYVIVKKETAQIYLRN